MDFWQKIEAVPDVEVRYNPFGVNREEVEVYWRRIMVFRQISEGQLETGGTWYGGAVTYEHPDLWPRIEAAALGGTYDLDGPYRA